MAWLSHTMLKYAPARRAAHRLLKRRAAVLMYHGLTESPLPVRNWCHLPVAEFRAQVEWLKQNYRVVPLVDIAGCLRENRPLPERAACITFDDGFQSVARLAAPILESLDLPFTIFLVGSLPGTGAPPWPEKIFAALLGSTRKTIWWDDRAWPLETARQRADFYTAVMARLTRATPEKRSEKSNRLMELLGDAASDWLPMFSTLAQKELASLTSSGLCSLGAHSHTHVTLTTCSDEQRAMELRQSRQALSEMHGHVDILAYPNGDYNASTVEAARDAGYQGAVTAEHRLCRAGDDVFEIPRVGIGAGLPMPLFECKVLGF